MKKLTWFLSAIILATVSFTSCDMIEETEYDESLLLGKWQSGTLFYRYDTGGKGVSWDTSEDITEAEAQAFTWTLIKDELTHIHIISMGGAVTKIYTVTELTETTLKYRDDFDNVHSFIKIE